MQEGDSLLVTGGERGRGAAHKINVDAGLVTLKRSVALVRHGLRKTARSMLERMFEDFNWSMAEVAEEAAANSVRLSYHR